MDNKHNDDYLFAGKHCNANFNNAQGFIRQIRSKWGSDVHFSHIISDYFFCPVGWARERWSPTKVFSYTIPAIASNILIPGGKLWLVTKFANVTDAIELNLELIATLYLHCSKNFESYAKSTLLCGF